MSGYPNRAESEHDWIENSHASTALSYAHGIAKASCCAGRRATAGSIAVVGDGALTGGMAYEALNNLGHSGCRVVIVLNDNGRSYAPTVSQLSQSLTSLRLNPTYTQTANGCATVSAVSPRSVRWPIPARIRSPAACAKWWPRTPSSKRSVCATPARSTVTTST